MCISVRVYVGETFRMWDNDVMDNAKTVVMTTSELKELCAKYTKTRKSDAEMCVMSGVVNSAGAWVGHPKMFWGK